MHFELLLPINALLSAKRMLKMLRNHKLNFPINQGLEISGRPDGLFTFRKKIEGHHQAGLD